MRNAPVWAVQTEDEESLDSDSCGEKLDTSDWTLSMNSSCGGETETEAPEQLSRTFSRETMLLLLGLFLLVPQCLAAMSSGCHSDRNSDDRPRVSCVNQSLTAVPDGIDVGTEVLVLSQNEFTSLSWAAYSAYAQLHELDLSQNHIRVIDPSGPVLEKLSVLRLSNNNLEGLGGRVFRFAPALMEVYLDGNALRTLHDATFGDLPQLEVIDLSRNQLPALPHRLLESVTSTRLKTFDLEDNCVQHLPDEFFSSKPELPYVFLSKNRWVCSCQVGYLQKYLEDQGHNVYKHSNRTMDLKDNVENGVDNVVCFKPPFMKGMVIVDLEEDQYCSAIVPTTPLESHEMASTFGQPTSAPEPTTSKMIPTTTEPGITTQSPTVTPATSSKIHEPATTTTTLSIPQTASTSTTPATSHSLPASTMSSIWTRFEFWTVQHFWTEVWSQWISESRAFNNTKRTELYSTASTSHEKNSTALPTSTLDPGNLSVRLPWTSPEPATPEPQSTSSTSHSRTSRSPHTSVPGLETLIPFDHASGESRSESSCMVPWCWWLFAGFLPLCILSALCSCMLFLWILITYLTLYRPIQRKLRKQGGGVTLLTFRNTLDRVRGGELGSETVKFLAPEKIPIESQAVFRSVLFIEKGDEEVEEDGRREGARDKGNTAARIELVPAVEEERMEVTMRREKEGREVTDKKEMFRKTLYRVISREEEIEGWRELEESWGMPERMTERRKTRYSLVLREENGGVEDMGGALEWLVGEWEMGGGGQMKEGSWGSLIRRIEGRLAREQRALGNTRHIREPRRAPSCAYWSTARPARSAAAGSRRKMTVHNLYIFDRNGTCLHYSEWNRKKQAGISKEEEFKLMYGMLFSIRSFVSKMSPLDMKDGFISFQTSRYKLHYYETPTGIKLVMNTDLGVPNCRDILHQLYSTVYVEYIVKNPLCMLGETLQSELFSSRLDSFIRALPFFSVRAA
ncbi:hypothetical protein MHYP_G00089710 [Metynnis hypsauchen]